MATRPHTFLFADLAGFTALTEAHGDEEAADAAAEFCEAVRALLSSYDAEEVKAIGDALLVRVADPTLAVRLGARIVGDYGGRHRALRIRVGIHTGTAVGRGNDWFGSAVNIAARIADLAQAGQVVLSSDTRDQLDSSVTVHLVGERALKNVIRPIPIYALDLGSAGPQQPIDPVCHMVIDADQAAARRTVADRDYLFCSEQCVNAFDADPAPFVGAGGTGS